MPRKGFDTAIRAAARLGRVRPKLRLVIAGGGRDDDRLRRLADELDAPVTFLGRVPNADLPPLYGCADVFAMLCRNRWGGLEQEGFGIVFVEAASCGVPQVAGDSGGAAEAVADGETGFVIGDPEDTQAVVDAFAALLDDDDLRRRMGERSRRTRPRRVRLRRPRPTPRRHARRHLAGLALTRRTTAFVSRFR